MIKRALVAIAVVIFLSPVSSAQTIVYDNIGGATTTDASPNDLSAAIGGEVVDDVTFSATTIVTGINWSGVYGVDFNSGDGVVAAQDDNFEVRIYADNAGTPGALVQSFAVGNSVNRTAGVDRAFSGSFAPGFDYSADINFTFDAGTTHWLSVLNNTTADSDNFYQSVTDPGGNVFGRLNNVAGATFVPQGFTTDFQLTSNSFNGNSTTSSAVPEPSSVGILALGLMGLFTRRKRS